MKNAETWVLVLQLSRKDGEINPCNVLVGHGLISADVDAVDGGVWKWTGSLRSSPIQGATSDVNNVGNGENKI